jgi:hypothetical protein
LLKRLQEVFRDTGPRFEPSLRSLFQGAGDVMGGLAQALSGRESEYDLDGYGLRVAQLKRALRGAAFARGSLFGLRPVVPAERWEELYRTLKQMEQEVFQELGRLRAKHDTDDP